MTLQEAKALVLCAEGQALTPHSQPGTRLLGVADRAAWLGIAAQEAAGLSGHVFTHSHDQCSA